MTGNVPRGNVKVPGMVRTKNELKLYEYMLMVTANVSHLLISRIKVETEEKHSEHAGRHAFFYFYRQSRHQCCNQPPARDHVETICLRGLL